MTAPGDAPVWRALLPPATVWVRPARPDHPWSRSPGASQRARMEYVVLPSVDEPVVVVSRDSRVLRYVTDSVLTAPPGGGRLLSMMYALGRRILRLPGAWTLARTLRPGLTVLVERGP